MRVLINGLNANNRSGTGRYINELAKALLTNTNDHEFLFIWPDNLAAPTADCEAQLIRKPTAALSQLYYDHIGIDRIARDVNATIVHYPTGIGPRFSKNPFILTVHDMCFFRHPQWFSRNRSLYYHYVMAAGIRAAAHILADSQATAKDIMELMNIPESRIDVVPLGVDEHFRPASEEQKRALRETYHLPEQFFLFVGTLEPRKNLACLLQAWRRVREQAPPMVITGRRGWGDSGVAGHETDRNLILLGHIPQEHLPALYSAATAFVWPSLMEGFGLPPLEAMACGAPVLTSNTSSLPEVAGDAAILVDPLSVDAIADAMRALARNAELREELRKKGLQRASYFRWRTTAEKTIKTYEKVAYGNKQVAHGNL